MTSMLETLNVTTADFISEQLYWTPSGVGYLINWTEAVHVTMQRGEVHDKLDSLMLFTHI